MSAPAGQIRAVVRDGGIKFRFGKGADADAAVLLCEAFDRMLRNDQSLFDELSALGYDPYSLRLQMQKGGSNR